MGVDVGDGEMRSDGAELVVRNFEFGAGELESIENGISEGQEAEILQMLIDKRQIKLNQIVPY